MKVHSSGSFGRGTLICCPGDKHPENHRWVNPQTGVPLQFVVKFIDGAATVDADLGEYLIANKYATRTPHF